MNRFLLLIFICLGAIYGSNYEEIYLKHGANEVIKQIEKRLQSKDFWLDQISKNEVTYGYYDNDTLLVVVDKLAKDLKLFEYKNAKLTQIFNTDVIVGKSGDKLIEGDLKTPIGVYELTRRFVPNDPYLGPLAFSLSYPNLLDKVAKKNGSGIWIHGFPLNGYRENEFSTKGCIAIKNDILLDFDKLIDYKRSFAIISEKTQATASKEQIAAIMAQIFAWKDAWQKNDITKYLSFYAPDFQRSNGMNLANFAKNKRIIFSRKENKTIKFTNFNITPYPNDKNEIIFRVSFHEDYKAPSYKFVGQKTLYLKLQDDDIKIIVEE